MVTITFRPGAVAAGGNIALPAGAPPLDRILGAELIHTGDYPNAAQVPPVSLAVVSGAPAAGQIQLYDRRTVRLGDATTNFHVLVIRGVAFGERAVA